MNDKHGRCSYPIATSMIVIKDIYPSYFKLLAHWFPGHLRESSSRGFIHLPRYFARTPPCGVSVSATQSTGDVLSNISNYFGYSLVAE